MLFLQAHILSTLNFHALMAPIARCSALVFRDLLRIKVYYRISINSERPNLVTSSCSLTVSVSVFVERSRTSAVWKDIPRKHQRQYRSAVLQLNVCAVVASGYSVESFCVVCTLSRNHTDIKAMIAVPRIVQSIY